MNKILIIGGGGREHALAWKLKQSPKVSGIFIAPGNAGTSQVGTNVDIKPTDFDALINFAKKENIYLTVVGPDDPLAAGIVDAFRAQGLKIWGASKKAAQIEASKAFAKELMQKNNIPTAEFKTFDSYEKALEYLCSLPIYRPINMSRTPIRDGQTTKPNGKIVIKASGLALGKGVAVCQNLDDAKKFLADVMVKKIFGDSGNQVVIEEFLEGMEFSTHAFSDGNTFQLLPPSQDHKAIFDGDKGPNTGGMGTIAPLPWVKQELMNEVAKRIVKPALDGMKKIDSTFEGLLYPGLMAISKSSFPPLARGGTKGEVVLKVIEFNCRFGDPETQSYMRLLKTDLFDILDASINGKLDKINIEWDNKFACCIVLASGGYPGEYKKGFPITGVDEAEKLDGIVVFHAGTLSVPGSHAERGGTATSPHPSPHEGRVAEGREGLFTNGGRILGVTALADDLKTALNKAYAAVKLIKFEGMHYRTDIGQKSLTA